MSYWDDIFSNDPSQHTPGQPLEATGGDDVFDLRGLIADQARQIGQLELTVEALVHILEQRHGLTRDELALTIQRIDLADGVEDGQMGPDQSLNMPSCHVCRRPVNPRRDICIYCHTPIEQGAAPRRIRTVRCAKCGKEVAELRSFVGEGGLVCGGCREG